MSTASTRTGLREATITPASRPVNTPEMERFFETAELVRRLRKELGPRKLQLYWDAQQTVLLAYSQAMREEIENIRTPWEYETVLSELVKCCRTDLYTMVWDEPYQELEPHLERLLALLYLQTVPTLETRLGQPSGTLARALSNRHSPCCSTNHPDGSDPEV